MIGLQIYQKSMFFVWWQEPWGIFYVWDMVASFKFNKVMNVVFPYPSEYLFPASLKHETKYLCNTYLQCVFAAFHSQNITRKLLPIMHYNGYIFCICHNSANTHEKEYQTNIQFWDTTTVPVSIYFDISTKNIKYKSNAYQNSL